MILQLSQLKEMIIELILFYSDLLRNADLSEKREYHKTKIYCQI